VLKKQCKKPATWKLFSNLTVCEAPVSVEKANVKTPFDTVEKWYKIKPEIF